MSPRPALNPKERKGYSGKEISIFAQRLQARRVALGLKQEDLAQSLGVHKGQISKYEAGVFPTTPERIVAIANALACTCDELLRPKE